MSGTCSRLLLALALTASAAHATDFSFKAVALPQALQTMGAMMKANLVICPGLEARKLDYEAHGVDALDALYTVTKAQGLQLKRINKGAPGPATYAIGTPEQVRTAYEPMNTRTDRIKYAVASELAKALADHKTEGIESIAADDRTNTLIMKGSEDALSRSSELIRDLDMPMPELNYEVSLVDPAKNAVLWKGSVKGLNGKVVKLDSGQIRGQTPGGQLALRVWGSMKGSLNYDNAGNAKASLHARVLLGGQPVDTLLNGQVNIWPGAASTLGTLSAGTGTVEVKLAVTPPAPRKP